MPFLAFNTIAKLVEILSFLHFIYHKWQNRLNAEPLAFRLLRLMIQNLSFLNTALKNLPFQGELLESISNKSDCIKFLDDFTIYYADDDCILFLEYVQESGLMEEAPKFFKDSSREALKSTVGALKHSFACKRLLTAISGFDRINALGLPYMFEGENDLDLAVQLFSKRRYKMATHSLRSALEATVTHVFFTLKGVKYDDLCYTKIPPMSNRNCGMLDYLTETDFFSPAKAKSIYLLYRELSNATHSQYKYIDTKFEHISKPEIYMRLLKLIREVSIHCLWVMLIMSFLEANGEF